LILYMFSPRDKLRVLSSEFTTLCKGQSSLRKHM